MKQLFQFLILIVFLFTVACGSSDEDKARIKIGQAKNLLQQQDTLNALLTLDSIPKLFPKAIYTGNAAKKFAGKLRFEILQKKENELDSLNVFIAEKEKSFVKEKTEFDRYAQYIPKRQTFKRGWNRSFIQVHLNEHGDLYLSSNFYGEHWLNHTGIKVYDKGDNASTEQVPLGNVDNHHSDFMKSKWEKVSFRNGKSDDVIRFIANNVDRRLKAVFQGKKYYYIVLEKYDKEAIREALLLSKALKRKAKQEKEIATLQKKLNIQ